jgi:hydroxymethylpyrimidine pyrophosphatase-like HAD family hydrolase
VRLVAVDLDGTFLNPDGMVSERGARAVRAARSDGLYVVPVTARAPWATWDIARAAGFGPLGVCGNGAVVCDLYRSEVLDHDPLGWEAAVRLVKAVREALPGIVFAGETIDGFLPENDLYDSQEARTWGFDLYRPVDDVIGPLQSEPVISKLLCHHPARPPTTWWVGRWRRRAVPRPLSPQRVWAG